MISFENVTKQYGKSGVKAVSNLTLKVGAGELFGFIGPNGAGKTTTIKLMTGILAPTSGTVRIGEYDIAQNPIEAKRMIGYVPDAQDMYERLTGMEYLNFMADVYGVSTDDRQDIITKYLLNFDMKGAAGSQIKSYSRGMRQKITIIGALLHKPDVWVLDEPMVGLDPRAAHLLKQEMIEHCKSGHTVFFSTHVLEVAEKLCTRIAIINKGALVAEGTLDELRAGEKSESLESIFLELTETEGANA